MEVDVAVVVLPDSVPLEAPSVLEDASDCPTPCVATAVVTVPVIDSVGAEFVGCDPSADPVGAGPVEPCPCDDGWPESPPSEE